MHSFCERGLWSESLEVYKQGMRKLSKYVKYEVGHGLEFKFWHDEPFKDQFLNHFKLLGIKQPRWLII